MRVKIGNVDLKVIMVDMAHAIDFRLGHCNGEFNALRSKNEKSGNY